MCLMCENEPVIPLNCPAFSLVPVKCFSIAGYKIFLTKVDFPLPETPVTMVKQSNGNTTSIFFKLFSRAPFTSITFLTGLRFSRSEEHTSELQSRENLVCRLLLE